MPTLEDTVKQHYGKVALTLETESCCSDTQQASDYSQEELSSVPTGAYLGEGSGNPVRLAELKQGEKVLDLGCGAGIDVFLAANKVGPEGHVLGIDMTSEMIERAKENAKARGYTNVEFGLSKIENLPLEDESVDVVTSNCVINLSESKKAVFEEIHRVLKPGGRLSIADIITIGKMPEELKKDSTLYCSCVTGAMEKEDYLRTIQGAGFRGASIVALRPSTIKMPDSVEAEPRAITLIAKKEA